MSPRAAGVASNGERPLSIAEGLISHVLLWGGLVSVALVLVGLVLYAAHGGFGEHTLDLRRRVRAEQAAPSPTVFVSLTQLSRGLAAARPLAVIALGLVLLLMTPVVGVAFGIVGFLWVRDYRYVVIASLVFCMLVLSVLLSGGAH